GNQEEELEMQDLCAEVAHEAKIDRLDRRNKKRIVGVRRRELEVALIETAEEHDRLRLRRPLRPCVVRPQRLEEGVDPEHDEKPEEKGERPPGRPRAKRRNETTAANAPGSREEAATDNPPPHGQRRTGEQHEGRKPTTRRPPDDVGAPGPAAAR